MLELVDTTMLTLEVNEKEQANPCRGNVLFLKKETLRNGTTGVNNTPVRSWIRPFNSNDSLNQNNKYGN